MKSKRIVFYFLSVVPLLLLIFPAWYMDWYREQVGLVVVTLSAPAVIFSAIFTAISVSLLISDIRARQVDIGRYIGTFIGAVPLLLGLWMLFEIWRLSQWKL